MRTKADPSLIRSINADLVLRLIRDVGPISRAEVARRSRLSEPTVSDLVGSLIHHGLIREVGAGLSTGGRRPTLLRFVPDAALAVGVDLDGDGVHAGLVDLAGGIIREARLPIRSGQVGDITRTIASTVRRVMTRSASDRVKGVGIAVPGVVQPESRTISFAPSLGWENVDLTDPLKAATGLAVCIENRANAAALGEFWRGAGEGWRDLVFVTVRVGIGAGIILGGKLYRGVSGAAGEIGYMAVDRTALARRPDDFGALEAVASSRAMVERMCRAMSPQEGTRLRGGRKLTPAAILRAAEAGDRTAARVIRETVQAMGMAVANLAAVLNPDLVVIGGSLTERGGRMLEEIRAILMRLVPVPPQVIPSALGGQAVLLGGAAQVFTELHGLGPHFPSRLEMVGGGRE